MCNDAILFRVKKTLSIVPIGNVVSYGQLADLSGLPGRARLMGTALRGLKHCPWHRVVRASGHIAFPAGSEMAQAQCARLLEEGVMVKNGRINMKEYGWKPDLHTILAELEY